MALIVDDDDGGDDNCDVVMVTSPIYCPIVDYDDDGDVVMMLMIIMPEPFPSVIPSLS